MTRNRAGKRATRDMAATTRRSYTDAQTTATDNAGAEPEPGSDTTPILARVLNQRMLARFRAAGWPVEAERVAREGRWLSYPGPVQLALSRPTPHTPWLCEEDPDDDTAYDLSVPPSLHVSFPFLLDAYGATGFVDQVWDCTSDVRGIVSRVDELIAATRREAIAGGRTDAICGICEEDFADEHLLAPTASDQIWVCPSCVFDGDLLWAAEPARLALGIDRLNDCNAAAPAGWAAVGALLTCARPAGVWSPLRAMLRSAGILFEPAREWMNPAWWWIWLPPTEHRPPALRGFGSGAGLGAIVREIDRAHPDLRQRVHARDHEIDLELEEEDDDVPGAGLDVATLDRCWPAIIAYVTAFTTQDHDRPGQRGPWHLLDSFDALADQFRAVGSDLDFHQVDHVLHVAIPVVADRLGVGELRW